MDRKNMTMETEICHNCKREVPQSNYLMHVAHCARNMAVCPVCGDAVPKAHLKEHRQQQHAIVECPACRYKLQSGALEQHRATQCGKRVVACQYCELELPHCDIADHEHYCGARTERCTDCGELVMLKYNKLHLDSNHGFLKLDDEPGPAPSWETPVAPVAPPKKSPVKTPFSSMSPLRGSLPLTTSSTPAASAGSRNNNINDIRAAGSAVSTNTASKTDYKKLMHSTTSHSSVTNSTATTTSNSSSVDSTPPVRDTPRTFVPAYDASEDLRAKVKLARHDLNEIKNSYMMTEERKHAEFGRHPSLELPATNKQSTRDKFITNLVPYEKNKSFQVNARPLDEKPAKKNYYNYLGAKEETPLQPLIPVVPPASAGLTNGNGTGALPKHKHTHTSNSNAASSNGTVPKQRELGAVPRPTRRRAPPPPVNIPVPQQQQQLEPQVMPGSLDEVTLPCEFCDKMIPAARLVQHETGCRPDLAQLHTHMPAVAADTMSPAPAHSPEVELPCEFCFSLYPASKLLSHQALCDV